MKVRVQMVWGDEHEFDDVVSACTPEIDGHFFLFRGDRPAWTFNLATVASVEFL